ncbi:Fur-regulated basic protein FbpA [Neobacillus niacini]|uniref:Fur-regulated basic protein FbpA n=1 Tax=Neobacillus niacini TaxID=86668 RepID=UPI003983CD36
MGKILREAVENRRLELINKLIAFGVYKKEEHHLFELSLTDLENEFKIFIKDHHPHSEVESLHWINKN